MCDPSMSAFMFKKAQSQQANSTRLYGMCLCSQSPSLCSRPTADTDDGTFVAFFVHHRGDPLQSYGNFELGEALTKIIMVDLLDGHNLINQVFNFFLILDLFLTFVTLFGQFSIFRCFCFDILCYYCRGQTRF